MVAVNVMDSPPREGFLLDARELDVLRRTISSTDADWLPEWYESPPYIAVSVWVPTESEEVVTEARPFASSVAVPSDEFPSLIVTVPPGWPPVPVTAIDKVIASPTNPGFLFEVRMIELAACWTVSTRGFDVAEALVVSPE
jgi:hypothetical protein